MANNSMNSFTLDYSAGRDDSQDSGDRIRPHLPPSLSSHDASLMGFPHSQVGNYAFSAMVPPEGDLSLQAFDRPSGPQGDLEGRLSNVMLAYESGPNPGVTMPVNLDAGNTFAYDVPTTYPTTSMGLVPPMGQNQIHPAFSPFSQSFLPAGQYLQQPPSAPPPPLPHKEPYPTSTNSTGSFEDSDFSRPSEASQVRGKQRPTQERQRPPPYGPSTSYRPQQPVAIQPKKPVVVVKGELHAQYQPRWFLPD